ncbi:arginine--tRNA ligase, partial [Acinetobacter baumannii]
MGKNPRELAMALAAELRADADIVSVEVAGPGFLNLRLSESYWHSVVGAVLSAGTDFGRSTIGGNARVNVEYVSA